MESRREGKIEYNIIKWRMRKWIFTAMVFGNVAGLFITNDWRMILLILVSLFLLGWARKNERTAIAKADGRE